MPAKKQVGLMLQGYNFIGYSFKASLLRSGGARKGQSDTFMRFSWLSSYT